MSWLGSIAAASWHWMLIGAFLTAVSIESVRPDHRVRAKTLLRWLTNMFNYVVSVALTATTLPIILISLFAQPPDDMPHRAFAWVDGWGGSGAVLVLGVLGIDLIEYVVHRLEHRFQVLWRFHAVHHADPDVDASTALLHHPVAYFVSAGLIGTIMTGLGLPIWAFAIYALLSVASGVFQHIATPVPDRIERAGRWIFVTPGMHHAHHSEDVAHYDTNFGGVLSIWDRLFGTLLLLDEPARASIRFGIGAVPGTTLGQPDTREHKLYGVLTMPFRIRFENGSRDPVRYESDETGSPQTFREV